MRKNTLWKNMFRRAAAAGLCAALAAGMTACSTGTGAGSPPDAASSAASDSESAEAAADSSSNQSGSPRKSRSEKSSNTASEGSAVQSARVPEKTDLSSRDQDASWNAGSPSITLNGASAEVAGSGAAVSGSVVTVSQAGTYVVAGTLTDGRLVVDAGDGDDVQIVLNGAQIASSDGPAVLVENADNVILTLADGTENRVEDGQTYAEEFNQTADAAIYSECDLAINGTGRLTVAASYSNGIATKDDLAVADGVLEVTSANHALKGKDSVSIAGGSFDLTAGGDGIQSDKDDDPEKGWIVIDGGKFTISAEGDGIQGETGLVINGGNFDVTTGGGSGNSAGQTGSQPGRFDFDAPDGFEPGFRDDPDGSRPGSQGGGGVAADGVQDGRHSHGSFPGHGQQEVAPDAVTSPSISSGGWSPDGSSVRADLLTAVENASTQASAGTSSQETADARASDAGTRETQNEETGETAGLSSSSRPSRGTLERERTESGVSSSASGSTSQKGLKSGANLRITGGMFALDCADDGVHANGSITVSGGTVEIASGDDGVHADAAVRVSTDVNITESVEGIEGAEITIENGTVRVISTDDGINGADDSGDMSANSSVTINGGDLYVEAGGDGLDVNGPLKIAGGNTVVLVNSSQDNGAVDCNGSFTVTGGTIVYGGTGTGTAPGGSGSYVYASGSFAAGSIVSLRQNGREICSAELSLACRSLIFAGTDIASGQSYDVYDGETLAATVQAGQGAPAAGAGGFGGFGGSGRQQAFGAAPDGTMPDGGQFSSTETQYQKPGSPDSSSSKPGQSGTSKEDGQNRGPGSRVPSGTEAGSENSGIPAAEGSSPAGDRSQNQKPDSGIPSGSESRSENFGISAA